MKNICECKFVVNNLTELLGPIRNLQYNNHIAILSNVILEQSFPKTKHYLLP